jgi:predicted nicotinamide N-methyase
VKTDEERRRFIVEHTELAPVPLVPEIRLHTASAITPLWSATADWLRAREVEVPFWSVPWAGGQALARFVLDRPELVRGARVLDFGAGSGLCAIAAAMAGAASVRAVDVDSLARVAADLNAAANGVTFEATTGDLVGAALDDVDVLLAGDVWYDREASLRFEPWFAALGGRGTRVLTGDPGRHYVPARCREVARYEVPTPLEIESVTARTTRVLDFEGRSAHPLDADLTAAASSGRR